MRLAAAAILAVFAAGVAQGAVVEQNDPYLWLEDVHGEKPLAWVREQNARTFKVLQADPRYQDYYGQILKVMDAQDRIPFGSIRQNYVFNFWQDARNPKGVWRRTTIASYLTAKPNWETLLDVDELSKEEGKSWVFKGASCTPDLKRCLVQLSPGGGDATVVREFDLPGRSFVKDGFSLSEAKSTVAWVDDDTVLFGTDFGKGSLTASGYPRMVKLWKRGRPIAEAKTVFEGKETDVGVELASFQGPDGTIAVIQNAPSFFETEYYTLLPDGTAIKIPLPLSANVKGVTRGQMLATLREPWTQQEGQPPIAKGSLIAFPIRTYLRTKMFPVASVLYTPDARSSVEEVATGRDAVYASIFHNVTGSIHVFRFENGKWNDTRLDLPEGGSPGIVSANDWGPQAEFSFESFLIPPTLYHDNGNGAPKAIRSLPARFNANGLKTEQFEATSKDGTKIPYFVVRQKDAKGPQPTVLYGYGGFEISLTPSYSANFGKLWLTRGGTYVLANIRGGGEFGPSWHDQALLTDRQKAFDDFEAVAEDIEKRGFTTPRQLGIMGGSNGGLLVSTVMTQRPDLLGAVVCQVPLIDMIRYTQIGAGASWAAEYGDPADPKMRDYILTYSPYQNVSADKKYPPVLFVTATSDDRVTPVHARKMAAKMEAQGHDVLFYENTEGGHAAAADHRQAAEMWALSFVYLAQKLGLP
ncbi:MAG TPA: prolyl oligopeptidase family serine peptidase [Rhizomicrobium sp.]|nr:prolyl oligopeptidase family serine peptidase [Rhizomicrobium sp.]